MIWCFHLQYGIVSAKCDVRYEIQHKIELDLKCFLHGCDGD